MNWAKITMYIMYILAIGISIGEHGKPKTGTINAWSTIIGSIIGSIILYFA